MAQSKLTLTIDGKVIEKAKQYAKRQGRSLSNLIEDYLKLLTKEHFGEKAGFKSSPIVSQLRGILKIEAPENFDEKKILEEELMKKYKLK